MPTAFFHTHVASARTRLASWWRSWEGRGAVDRALWIAMAAVLALPIVALLLFLLLLGIVLGIVGLAFAAALIVLGIVRANWAALVDRLRGNRGADGARDGSGREGVRVIRRQS